MRALKQLDKARLVEKQARESMAVALGNWAYSKASEAVAEANVEQLKKAVEPKEKKKGGK